MGLILSIETAISVCSVALHREGKLLGLLELHQDNVHSQKLMPSIDSLMQRVGVATADLDAIAVSAGPGSYTGLRIGVSTAKGFAYAHNLPLIGVDTLDALALRVKDFMPAGSRAIPMMDARRMEVYCKTLNHGMEELTPLAPVVVDEDSFGEDLQNGPVLFIGDAVEKVANVIRHENARFIPLVNSAESVGQIAFGKFEKKDFVDLAYFEPNYLKEFRVIKSKKNPLLS
ncbi:tRNA (adenosine(37)-N6)-threonylcarbamoyltransferase complex dimerization subunit type 1 TsaB [Litoribacter ruber]|uniref:tRNA (adenosine(37)-N6)-threonylcarbamoyltransferase complex dimerization subunit type 1 TsaB n=1 Tax=Litoribacter ruber TaxID=702568 RepID=UPI001BD9B957|nr:tRNA (adenosine(37)-N6)-threonylcarbamoyltransferase complex dimerization subunit type 1 TsaB [Litoribacter ruber]MBT0812287.1 tRNA (adenosine(37)-N6)-threonylcarbamoyltransferase complex dimerization subunit type 1 TsaB [Litoribacter ruber]